MDKETHYVIPRRDGKVTVMRKPPTTASDDPLDGNEELILELWQQLQSSQSENEKKAHVLESRDAKIFLLSAYAKHLEEVGHMDTDWRTEEPFAIDKFLKKK